MNYFRKSRLIGFKSLIYVFVCAHQQEVRERSNQDGKLIKTSICVDATQICERAPLPIFHSSHVLIQFMIKQLNFGCKSICNIFRGRTFLSTMFLHCTISFRTLCVHHDDKALQRQTSTKSKLSGI